MDEDNLHKAQLCLQSRDVSTDSRKTSGCVSPALLQLPEMAGLSIQKATGWLILPTARHETI